MSTFVLLASTAQYARPISARVLVAARAPDKCHTSIGGRVWAFLTKRSSAVRRSPRLFHSPFLRACGAAALLPLVPLRKLCSKFPWARRKRDIGRGSASQGPDVSPVALAPSMGTNGVSDVSLAVSKPQWQKVQTSSLPDPYHIAARVFPLIFIQALWSAVVACAARCGWRVQLPFVVHPLMVGALGLLLAFRTNQAFERHWSSCRAWAELHGVLHNISRLASHIAGTDYPLYLAILRHLVVFPFALKQKLRKRREPRDYTILHLAEYEQVLNSASPHAMILATLSMLIQPIRASDDGRGLKLALWASIDNNLAQLNNIACNLALMEHVPLPASYTLFTHRFVLMFVSSIPFVLVGYMHPFFVVPSMIGISWAIFSMEELALVMEDPFNSPETVPLDAYCERISIELRQQAMMQRELLDRVQEESWVVKPHDIDITMVHEQPAEDCEVATDTEDEAQDV
eukprot:TRINITY_DN39445_c0_g1_i1.p1 TRINITY_DN39445_c0_g1~~TRINITY_DN39445_c0_g1_i1.p1  ORF type:complete len:459 (-),score=47.77 TRINITY_DN39445_c0_g1_i1:302-1678(-)